MKKLSINELIQLADLMSQCNNDKDLKNPSTVLSGIRLTKSINSSIKKYFEEQELILSRFGVEKKQNENGTFYDWNDRSGSEIDKINSAMSKLNETTYAVEHLNKIDEEDFVIYTRGLNSNQILFLYDYLVKED
jgi:hypothetical protein